MPSLNLLLNFRRPKFSFIALLVTSSLWSQQTEVVDFLSIDAFVAPKLETQSLEGGMKVKFQILKDADSVYLDAINMSVLSFTGQYQITHKATKDKIWLLKEGGFKKGTIYTTDFTYQATPKQALYFTKDQIWTQGQGKYTSHWLPSIDDMNDKIEFDIMVITAPKMQAISNGKLKPESLSATKDGEWRFDMKQPMSSYLVALAIGEFRQITTQSATGVPLEFYYRPEDSLFVEPTYRYSKEIFDFLETEIGVAYPWQNYKQVPVRDFLYAGMENTTATIFSEAFVVDSIGFNDRNYVNVNAHELAHQWFGNLVTETEGTHHWLQEGFATYYALLAERELFGDDYYYWKLLQSAEQLENMSSEGKGESLLNPKASSLTFYEKGAWALHMLKELIGEDAFKTAVKSYLEKHQFKNVTTADFLAEVRLATLIDITAWEKDWLQQSAFKSQQALESLVKSKFVNDYFKAMSYRNVPFSEKQTILESLLRQPNDYLGQEAVYQLASEPITETFPLYQLAMQSKNSYIRQAIVTSVQEVSPRMRPLFEELLLDPSYVTQEFALAGLTAAFPEDRLKYLEQTKYVVGFQNKNIKLLWLAIAISSEVYGATANDIFLAELRGYTSDDFSFEVRQQAFQYVFQMQLFDTEALENLVNAAVHHNWRFRNFARDLLKTLIEKEPIKKQLETSMDQFSDREQGYLQTIMTHK